MRQFNLRLILWLAGIFVVVAVSIHFLHGYQVHQNKDAFLEMARETKASLRTMLENQSASQAELEESVKQTLTFYRRYLGLDPEDLGVRIEYAKFLLELGDFRSAYAQNERILRQTVTGNPELKAKQDEVRRRQIQLAGLSQQYSDAIYHVDQLLETEKNDPELLTQRGQLRMRQEPTREHTKAARESLELAIEHGPDQLPAYSMLARLQLGRDGNREAAESTIEQMVEANPESADAYVRRAQFVLSDNAASDWTSTERRQRVEKALADCQKAISLTPEDPDAINVLAVCQQRLSDLLESPEQQQAARDKALELTKQLVTLTENNPQPQLYLRWSNLELGRNTPGNVSAPQKLDAAVTALRQGIDAVDPEDNFMLRFRLAELLLSDASRRQQAVELIEQLREDTPGDHPLVGYLQARHLMIQQKWLAAAQTLENHRQALEDRSETVTSQVDRLLGECYKQLGYDDRYLEAAQRAVQRDSLDVQGHLNLAQAFRAAGRLPEAIEQYEIAFSLQGAPVSAYKQYASLLLTQTYRQSPDQRDWAPLQSAIDRIVQQTSEDDPWPTLMRAQILIEQEQLAEAEQLLEDARDAHPNQLGFWRALVLTAQRAGNAEQAWQRFEELREKFGDTVTVRSLKAELIARHEPDDALDQLDQLAADVENFSQAERFQLYWQLARTCFSLSDYNQGLQFARQAADLSPQNVLLRLFMLKIARLAKNPDVAEQLAEEIGAIETAELAANSEGPEEETGDSARETLQQLKDQQGAVTLYAQAAAKLTRYRAAVAAAESAEQGGDGERGQRMEQAKRENAPLLDQAAETLQRARRLRDNWSEIPVLQGIIAGLQGHPDEQTDYFRLAIELGNRNTNVAYHVVQTLAQEASRGGANSQGKWLRADAIIRKLQDRQSRLPVDLERLASEINYRRQDYERAFDLARPLAQTGEARHQRWAGQVAMAMQRYDEAQQYLESAANNSPQDPVAWTTLVRCLLLSDQPEQAEATMNEALEKVEPASRLAVHAECLQMMDKRDKAVTLVRESVNSPDASPTELRTAARFFANSPDTHDDAAPLLERFAGGELKALTNPAETRRWARRTLARILGGRDYAAYLRALKLLDENLSEAPDSVPDRQLRAKLRFAGARTAEAREKAVADLLRLADQPRGLDTECRFLLAQHYRDQDDWGKYRQEMTTLLSASEGNPRQRNYMASYVDALLERGDTSTAQGIAATLRRKWPNHFNSYLVAARAQLAGPRPRADDAMEAVREAIEDPDVQPESEADKLRQAATRLGSVTLELRQRVQELETAAKAETASGQAGQSPIDPKVVRQRLETELASVETVSRGYFDQLAETDPAQRLAVVPYLAARSETSQAVELIKQHWQSVPPDNLAGTCQPLLGDVSTTERQVLENVLQQALEQHQGTEKAVPLLSVLAHHFMQYGQYEESIALYQDLVEKRPADAGSLNNLALLMATREQNLAQALEYVNQAADIVGEQPFVLDSRATVLLANNQPGKALQDMQELIAAKPRNINKQTTPGLAKRWGGYHFHLAVAYQANNQPDKAAAEMEKATQLGFTEQDVFAPELQQYRELLPEQ